MLGTHGMKVYVCVRSWSRSGQSLHVDAGCPGVYLGVFEHLSVDESPNKEYVRACTMSIGGLNVK